MKGNAFPSTWLWRAPTGEKHGFEDPHWIPPPILGTFSWHAPYLLALGAHITLRRLNPPNWNPGSATELWSYRDDPNVLRRRMTPFWTHPGSLLLVEAAKQSNILACLTQHCTYWLTRCTVSTLYLLISRGIWKVISWLHCAINYEVL